MIYTAIFGNKDKPRNDVYQFKENLGYDDPRMAAKIYKILPHLFMDVKWSVWIDGNIRLNISEKELIWMTKPHEIGVFKHWERNCIYDEGEFCKKVGKGNPEKIDKQLFDYKKMGYPQKNGLGQCSIIVRKHTPAIERLNEKWWAHISRYSIRDQISFPVVFGEHINYLPKVHIRKNRYWSRPKHLK
jgi:hypothetical protein